MRGGAAGTKPPAAHWAEMIRLLISAALLPALAGCGHQAAAPEGPTAAQSQTPPAPAPSADPVLTPPEAAAKPGLPSASRDPDVVLHAWADAVEARDWAAVRAFWGDHGARSGLSEAAFAAHWSGLRHPKVSLAKGESEGAAGSLYYTAPVRIIDGARVISGEVVIRRVNDVDGASAEQLRWHIESTTLTP